MEAMAQLCKEVGHEVRCAITGRAAIEAAKAFRPEVVVLDVHLPDVPGDKVARQLKSQPGMKSLRVIAISGDDRMRVPALNAGCSEFYLKPVSLQLLEKLLRE